MSYATILAGFALFFYADSCRRFVSWLIRSRFRDNFVFLFWGGPGVAFFGLWILYGAHPRPQGSRIITIIIKDYYYYNCLLLFSAAYLPTYLPTYLLLLLLQLEWIEKDRCFVVVVVVVRKFSKNVEKNQKFRIFSNISELLLLLLLLLLLYIRLLLIFLCMFNGFLMDF